MREQKPSKTRTILYLLDCFKGFHPHARCTLVQMSFPAVAHQAAQQEFVCLIISTTLVLVLQCAQDRLHRETREKNKRTNNQSNQKLFLRTKRPHKPCKSPTLSADPPPKHLLDPGSHCLAPLLVQLDDMWPGSTVALLHPLDLRDPSNPPTATNLASNIFSMETVYMFATEQKPNKHQTPQHNSGPHAPGLCAVAADSPTTQPANYCTVIQANSLAI